MFESMPPPASLVELIESTHRQESVLVARRLAAVAALLRHRVAAAERPERPREYAAIDGFEQAAAEVAAAMNLSPVAASYVVSYAEALDTRLPKVGALLADGRTDWRTVRLIISRTDLVTDEKLIAEIDRSLAERIGSWHGWSKQRIINAVDAAVRAADPDAARERRVTAQNDRYVGISTKDDGMADIYGSVAATAATAFDRRLSQLAKQVCAADPRTLDQRRADALAALAEGRGLVCACGEPECPNRTSERGPDRGAAAQVVINVVASDQTVHAGGGEPGYLEGYGVIDAEQVRDLAATASVLVADPVTSPVEALRYQPSAALERAVRCRDLTCRFPGCSRPAVVCDLDHTIPFNHQNPAAGGPTVAENLKCLCRQHHRLKTFGGWRDKQLTDGTVIWVSPAGRTYRTSPAGADLFPRTGRPACAPPLPARRTRSQQRSARIAQARKHNRVQRPINEARRALEEARQQEIAARKFRNHMRDMLFLFTGAPSTSPFCTWVNDPKEPEELPPDWIPDEPAPQPLPDDPPF
ncbi:HNH endonuclease signature motif containing protein [Mycobacterium sp. E3247]|uniref:HNH endonuclease signature motif containing protein n=1 Tax=Mycobacterium sp. E3247 TaxID=1856864 RepID=UPI00080209DF|nr:HNH endonuclease signature motif containing protein [Mycobacterium sp. E3247]OBH03532.1 HNH nuclease [Mycobacterium sp. E3247]